MQAINKFMARGITKDRKFVYGYYFKSNTGRHIITNSVDENEDGNFTGYGPTYSYTTEIIQEPDRFVELYDINNKPLFVNDKYIRYDAPRFKYDKPKIATKFGINYGEFEIIGNTHNIKEDL